MSHEPKNPDPEFTKPLKEFERQQSALELRRDFARAAMQALITGALFADTGDGDPYDARVVAENAWAMADAMIEADKPKPALK